MGRFGRALVPMALALCTPSTPTVFAQNVRDSAGIRIVTSAKPVWSAREQLVLSDTPRLQIGSAEAGPLRFGTVRAVAQLANGEWLIANGVDNQLRRFSARGEFLAKVDVPKTPNSRGATMAWATRLADDTIAVSTGGSSFALFHTSGTLARTVDLEPPRDSARPMYMPLAALINANVAVVTPFPTITKQPVGTRWVESVAFEITSTGNTATRPLGSLRFGSMVQESAQPSTVWLSPTAVILGANNRFYYGFGDQYEIRVYTPSGKLETIIRRAWTPTPISDADWEEWVVEWSKLWIKSTGAQRDREMNELRKSPWAEQNPAFSQFLVDRRGRLWVREAHWQDAIAAGSLSDPARVPSVWSVFDVRGRWLGDVRMPEKFRPLEIGADYVAGTLRADSVSRVTVFDLKRASARATSPH